MKFKEFVQLLHPVIGAGSSTHAFTRSIFDAIITDEGQAVLEEYTENTYKAYFNGNTGISKLAKKICAYIEPEEFSAFFDQFSDAAIQSLCDSFQVYLPDITSHNAGNKLAELFAEIIKDAASTKKKGTRQGANEESEKTASIEAEVVDDEKPSGAADEIEAKVQIIEKATVVNQYGENCVHINHVDTFKL